MMGFESDIRPLFRPRDRQAMTFAFDLHSYDDVSDNADHILRRLQAGEMPCDEAWPQEKVAIFEQWVKSGKQP
jgi:hypothetical protein